MAESPKSFLTVNVSKTLPPLVNCAGELVFDEVQKAEILNDFFAQQTYIGESDDVLPALASIANRQILSSILITACEVQDALMNLPMGKACGTDGINYRVLLEGANGLSQPLCDLFNMSLSMSTVPNDWKMSNVCAILKKGDVSILPNNRPISFLNTMEKVLERIIFKHVLNVFRDSNFFTKF